MKKSFRFLTVALGAVSIASAVCVAGCGPKFSGTLRIAYKDENREEQIVEAVGELFMSKYPDVTIEYVPFSGDTFGMINNAVATNTEPDIFLANSFDMLSLSGYSGLLMDFSSYMERDARAGAFDLDDYYSVYWELGQKNFNGEQYLIPRSCDRVVLHYNKSLIKKAEEELNVDIIDGMIHNGWTWDEFHRVCDILKQSSEFRGSSKYLISCDLNWEALLNPIYEAMGVKEFDEAGNNTIDADETALKGALDFFKTWVDKAYIAPQTGDGGLGFESGGKAFFFHSQTVSDVAQLLNEKAFPGATDMSDYYDIVTVPVFEDHPLIGAGAAGYCAVAYTEKPDLVWEFMKTLISRDGQNAIADSGINLVPIRKDMADYKDPANHWGVGYEKFNLEAYLYNTGKTVDGTKEPDWNCYSDFFLAQDPRYATNLIKTLGNMTITYANGRSYADAVSTYKREVETILSIR